MQFQYQAMNPAGAIIRNTLSAATAGEAADQLRGDGLMVMRLTPLAEDAPAQSAPPAQRGGRIALRDLLLFAQQMRMLLTAGATLVAALDAAARQTTKPRFRTLLQDLRTHVEEGGELSEALQKRPDVFRPIDCTIIAAGEATATLPAAFAQFGDLIERQSRARKTLTSALIYPAVLAVLGLGVIALMIGFVVPRFQLLFKNLDTTLPVATELIFGLATGLKTYWPLAAGAVLLGAIGVTVALHVPHLRTQVARGLFRVPLLSGVLARLELGRVLRVWAALLRSNVSLVDTLTLSRSATTNPVFGELLDDVESAVTSGAGLGAALEQSPLVPPVVTSALRTGEENGKLSESVAFVANWLDDENTQLVTNLTKTAEPVMLGVMGVIVGLLAMALFLPLFDMATAA